jgi:hypothetical protein
MFIIAGQLRAGAQENVGVTEVAPHVVVFSTSSGNVVASVGKDGALLVGTPSAASTAKIAELLKSRTSSSLRCVVIYPEPLAQSEGDAGWGRLGAFVAMQELALQHLGGGQMGAPLPLPDRLAKLDVDRPHAAFSEVLNFDLNGEAIHIIRQTPGYSNADAITHFHAANLVYLGEVFPGDGYPLIDHDQGGTLEGLVKTLGAWAGGSFRVVPARGAVTDGAGVKAFLDMVVTVRDRVQAMIKGGKTEDQVFAEHPTREFDARWGHGRTPPDLFVRGIYDELKKQ